MSWSSILVSIWHWLTAGTTVALAHRYFLSFANGMPDLPADATYWQRCWFNFIQGVAGNERRVVTTAVLAVK